MSKEVDKCNHTFELANGEFVSPCHLPKYHLNDCVGYCLGSVCKFPKDFDSEYDIHINNKRITNENRK